MRDGFLLFDLLPQETAMSERRAKILCAGKDRANEDTKEPAQDIPQRKQDRGEQKGKRKSESRKDPREETLRRDADRLFHQSIAARRKKERIKAEGAVKRRVKIKLQADAAERNEKEIAQGCGRTGKRAFFYGGGGAERLWAEFFNAQDRAGKAQKSSGVSEKRSENDFRRYEGAAEQDRRGGGKQNRSERRILHPYPLRKKERPFLAAGSSPS